MYLFYVLLTLFLLTGFIAGYKTGFLKLWMSILITAVAVCSSCYFFILFHNSFNSWLDLSIGVNIIILLLSLFFIVLGIILLFLKVIPFRLNVKSKSITGNIMAGITGTFLCIGLFTFFITYSDVLKVPDTINKQLEETGVTDFLESSTETAFAQIHTEEKTDTGIILAADNTKIPVEEKFTYLPFITTRYTIRPDLEKQMLELINKERSIKGFQPLENDSLLTFAARKHTADMFARGYFSHKTPEGITPFNRLHTAKITYLFAGENLAFSKSLDKAHEGLMLSPGHRANILNKQYHKVGIGVLENVQYGLLITQEFTN